MNDQERGTRIVMTTADLMQMIGEQVVEIRLLRRQLAQANADNMSLGEQVLGMSRQIGADHGEPT